MSVFFGGCDTGSVDRRPGGADHELGEFDLVDDPIFSQEGVPQTHQSTVLKFKGLVLLEFVDCQLVGSSMIFSEPLAQRKTDACSVPNVLSSSLATQRRTKARGEVMHV